MDYFRYEALRLEGFGTAVTHELPSQKSRLVSRIRDLIPAGDEEEARAKIYEMGLRPISVKKVSRGGTWPLLAWLPQMRLTKPAPAVVQRMFWEGLRFLGGRMEMAKALNIVADRIPHKGFADAIRSAATICRSNGYLEDALEKAPQYVSRVQIAVLRAGGHSSEGYGPAFGVIVNLLQRRDEIRRITRRQRRRFIGGLAASGALLAFLLTWYIPATAPALAALHKGSLPGWILALQAFDHWIMSPIHIVAITAVALGLWAIARAAVRLPVTQEWLYTQSLRIPLYGWLLRAGDTALVARSLGALLPGLSEVSAMRYVTDVSESAVVRTILENARNACERGVRLADALSDANHPEALDPILPAMLDVGTFSEHAAEGCTFVAEYLEAEAHERALALSDAVDTAQQIILGVLLTVAGLVVYIPYFQAF